LLFESAGRLPEAAAVYSLMVERLDTTPPGDAEPQTSEEFDRVLGAARVTTLSTAPRFGARIALAAPQRRAAITISCKALRRVRDRCCRRTSRASMRASRRSKRRLMR
jgi:hypothetical protein